VQADYAIELGSDDEVLEFPWSAPGQGLEYYDLKRHPELLHRISEAEQVPELARFLAAVNSTASSIETVKCDAWTSTEINPEEEIFAAPIKFGSYVDIIYSEMPRRFSLPEHESMTRTVAQYLCASADIPASAELLIRRCYYHPIGESSTAFSKEPEAGFYSTFYLFGYGADEMRARMNWSEGLKLAHQALQHARVLNSIRL
jgi:hypothetical protein